MFTSPNLLRVMCHMLHVTCHVSHVMCHMSCVTSHMSCVTCHMSCVIWFFFYKVVDTCWWMVCYQLGLPRLACTHCPHLYALHRHLYTLFSTHVLCTTILYTVSSTSHCPQFVLRGVHTHNSSPPNIGIKWHPPCQFWNLHRWYRFCRNKTTMD